MNSFKEMISYVYSTVTPRMLLLSAADIATCSKYQFMEVNQQRRAAGLKDKIPDIQKTLETVRFLKSRKVGVYTRCFAFRHNRSADVKTG